MIDQWKIAKSFVGYNFDYTGQDHILRHVTSYEDRGTINFYIRCAATDKTKETLERVQNLFNQTLKDIQSRETQQQQIENGDCKRTFSYPEITLKNPEFKLSKNFYKEKYRQLQFEAVCGRYISIFINVLDAVFKLGKVTEEMHTKFKIRPTIPSPSLLELYVEHEEYEKAFQGALEAAKWPQHQDIQFEFGIYLESKELVDQAYRVYNSIKPDHPLFERAKERMFFIIQNEKSAMEQMATPQSELDKEELLVHELDVMMSLPEDQQQLVDQRIHELCGKKDMQPVLTNVRYDGKTILAFCKHIAELNKKIAQLESK